MSALSQQLKLSWRNTRRNKRRTLLTAATVLVGTALTTVTLAFLNGVFDQIIGDWIVSNGHARILDKDYLARETLRPLYENLADVDPLLERVRAVPGVRAAEPRITTGVVVAVGEEIGEDYAMLVGASETYYTEFLDGPGKIVLGEWLSGRDDEVVLGRKVASQVDAKIGQKILLLGQTQYGSMSPISAKVVGVIASDSLIDHQAFVSLETARWMVDLEGGAIEIMVFSTSDDLEAVEAVTTGIASVIDHKTQVVQSWRQRDFWAQSLPTIEAMRYVISGILLFVMVLAIFNTMTMSVMERTTEIGVLRALGQTRLGAVWMFLLESAAIGALGGIAGVAVGAGFGLYLERVGVTLGEELVDKVTGTYPMTATMHADMSWDVAATALAVGVLTAMIGAALPALRAASVQPYEAMQARR